MDIPELRRLLSEIFPNNGIFEGFEVGHEFPTIGHRVMLLNARQVDNLQLILLAIEDITQRRRAEQAREMLVGELNHRVKNSFAVIQALALGSLARIHDLLFESHWRGAELRSLAGTLQPLAGERAEALHLDGAPVRLNSRQALTGA